jgi:hypothetical protein
MTAACCACCRRNVDGVRMEMQRIHSESIRAVGYNPENRILLIEFNNNGLYKYFDVPDSIYTGLMGARSKGAYVNRYVRDHFSHKKIR